MSDGNGQLRAFVERIMRLREDATAIKGDIREVYAEAKANGFDKTVLGLRVRMEAQTRRELSVYFAAFRAAKVMKIGISGDVPKRLKTLSSIVKDNAELLLTFPGVFALEGWYHAEFSPWRRQGEWFDLCTASIAKVERIRSEGPAIIVRKS